MASLDGINKLRRAAKIATQVGAATTAGGLYFGPQGTIAGAAVGVLGVAFGWVLVGAVVGGALYMAHRQSENQERPQAAGERRQAAARERNE